MEHLVVQFFDGDFQFELAIFLLLIRFLDIH